MDRREFVRAVLMAVLFPCAANAQQAKKIVRIGYLSLARIEVDGSWVAAFREGLRELGYVEGRNLVIEQRHAAGQADRLPALAEELLRLKIDVLVVYGAWHLGGKIPPTTPVVFTVVPDPVALGLVASLARPGGNMTGLADNHDELVPKRLELIREVVPAAARVAVLLYPNRMSLLQLKTAQAAAPVQGMTLVPVEIKGPQPEEIDRAFAVMRKEAAAALLVIAEPTLSANRKRIADFALKNRLPAIGTVRDWAEAGFLMSYGTNFHELWRRAATYVDKILKGAKPGDLPVEQPTKFDLIINLRTAKALGINVPRALVLRADNVIE